MPGQLLSHPDSSEIVWEKIPCPLCFSGDEQLLLAVPAEPADTLYRLVRCRQCGLGYLNPRPTPVSISRFYPDDYKPYQPRQHRPSLWQRVKERLEKVVLSHFYGYPPKPRGWAGRLLARLARPLFGPSRDSLTSLPFIGQGRLLDFGCGSGLFARRMRQRGWDVIGMDFSHRAAEQASTNYGIRTLTGTLPHPDIEPGSLDAISMGSVLEHIHWPHVLIEAAAEALRPGGLLAVCVPNLDSWSFRTFGLNWFGIDAPRHLLQFTPATLRRLVESHGFEVTDMRQLGRTSWMRESLKRLRHASPSKAAWPLAALGRWRVLSGLLTRWTVWARQADCLLLLARRKSAYVPNSSAHDLQSRHLFLKRRGRSVRDQRVHHLEVAELAVPAQFLESPVGNTGTRQPQRGQVP
jgi:2-polyprenyl-3-methyl-5-hydroxy-6-metoxy-1,4-benzoquinol methylase